MNILTWLFGQRTTNADRVDAELGKIADSLAEANLRIRQQVGLELSPVVVVPKQLAAPVEPPEEATESPVNRIAGRNGRAKAK